MKSVKVTEKELLHMESSIDHEENEKYLEALKFISANFDRINEKDKNELKSHLDSRDHEHINNLQFIGYFGR